MTRRQRGRFPRARIAAENRSDGLSRVASRTPMPRSVFAADQRSPRL